MLFILPTDSVIKKYCNYLKDIDMHNIMMWLKIETFGINY